jgi:hypothetical protein
VRFKPKHPVASAHVQAVFGFWFAFAFAGGAVQHSAPFAESSVAPRLAEAPAPQGGGLQAS